mgnify:FL=1
MNIYMDAEFDGVRKGSRFIQCLIFIGLIAIDNECVVDSYYSLIRPRRFHKLSKTVRRMTKLSDEEIKKAPDFREVMDEINAFINALNSPYELYTFGPDDVRTLKHQAVYEGYGNISALTKFTDLQRKISNDIIYKKKVASDMLSLDDLKYIYGIGNKVEHNALNDAVDLYLIHEANMSGAIQAERLEIIAERRRQKVEDARKRTQMHMQNILFERYHFYEHQKSSCALYLAVSAQLNSLQERGLIHLPFHLSSMLLSESCEQGKLTMEWLMYPQPLVKLMIELGDEVWKQDCLLTYGNSGAIERIWRICEGSKQ